MFCSKCGKEINNDVNFCNFCGQKIISKSLGSNNISNEVRLQSRSICMQCNGIGSLRSTAKMAIAIVSTLLLATFQCSYLGAMILFGDEALFVLAGIIAIAVDGGILYWGLKERMCPICHGSGRIAL